MLQDIDITIKNTLAFRIDGAISQHDMFDCLQQLKAAIRQYGDVQLYEEIPNCGAVELAGLRDKFQYLQQQKINGIVKVAIVSNKDWQHSAVKVDQLLFSTNAAEPSADDSIAPRCDVRSFTLAQKKQALAFLQAPVLLAAENQEA